MKLTIPDPPGVTVIDQPGQECDGCISRWEPYSKTGRLHHGCRVLYQCLEPCFVKRNRRAHAQAAAGK